MKISKSLIAIKAIGFLVAIGFIAAYCIVNYKDNDPNGWLSVLSIISTCAATFISFYSDFFGTFKRIDKRGCYSIYDTIDCDEIVEELVNEIEYGKKVIYLNCEGLNRPNIYNLKLKIHQYFSCNKFDDIKIGNVRYLDKFDIDEFNVQIFENHKKKKNIYIFDYLTTNEYFINMAATRIQNSKDKKVKSTVIIYLANHSIKSIETSSKEKCDSSYIEGVIRDIKKQNKEKYNVTTLYELIANDEELYEKVRACKNEIDVYNYELDKIIIRYYLIVGKYDKALDYIIMVISANKQDVTSDYDFIYILADAFHLTNRYSLALELIDNYYSNAMEEDLKKKYLKLKLHILKHQGKFDNSIKIGTSIKNSLSDDDLNCKLLSIRMLRTIYNNLNKTTKTILKDKSDFSKLIVSFTPNSFDVLPRYNMYKAIIIAFKDIDQSMRLIDDCIEFFEKTNHRYIYNAYYVKAELLRYMNRFMEAYQYYLKSSGIYDNHYDKNLLDQNYFSTRCLEKLGLVNGNLSERIMEYKKNNDLSGLYNSSINSILPLISFKPKNRKKVLQFNKRLLSLVDDNNFDADKIKAILLKYLFIIL